MSRWLAPLVGIVGLLTLVVGMAWAEWNMDTMGGVPLVFSGVLLLVLAGVIAAGQEVSARHRQAVPRR